jgi:outer membrane protein OmpA-like peptidoglycan-associated protein
MISARLPRPYAKVSLTGNPLSWAASRLLVYVAAGVLAGVLFVPAAAIYSHSFPREPAPIERSLAPSGPAPKEEMPAAVTPEKGPVPVADKAPLVASGREPIDMKTASDAPPKKVETEKVVTGEQGDKIGSNHDRESIPRALTFDRKIDSPKISKLAQSDYITTDDILRALSPKPITRGLTVTERLAATEETKFVTTIRGRTARSLSASEREEIATIAKDKPRIDLEIAFDYKSADISAKSLLSVQALGHALSSADLKGSTFIIAGYTDAIGGDAYNQELSELRADSIKHYLTDHYGIAASDLVTVGYGKSKLKDPSQPMGAVNRRVQIFNMTDPKASK